MTHHSACNVEQLCKDLAVVSHAKVAELPVVVVNISFENRYGS